MSRKRLIAPGFFTDADLYDAEVASGLPLRIAYAGLWTVTDRRGVFKWSRNLKPDVLPYDPCDFLACLVALETLGAVTSYVVRGKRYGLIPTFKDHQTFHQRERPSADPGPEMADGRPAQGQPEALEVTRSIESTGPAQGQHRVSPEKAVPSPTVTVTGTGTGTGTASTAPTGIAPVGASRDLPVADAPQPAPEPPAPPKPSPYPKFVAQFGDRWAALVGKPDFGRIAGDLKDLHRVHGPTVLLGALENFARHRSIAVAQGTTRPDGWPQFVADFADYIPKRGAAA